MAGTLSTIDASAGEIPGLAGNVPLAHAPAFDFAFYNDFLARGGRLDDLRTQQLALSGRLDGRYHLALDLSILTARELAEPGRVDQLSATFGVAVVNSRNAGSWQRVVVGAGIRAHGNFAGERIQNGFHRLIQSEPEVLPYSDGETDSPLAFADAQHQATFGARGAWTPGYWLRGNLLATLDGQLDASAGAYLTLDHRHASLWAGLRRDWRSGYDAAVTSAVADAESDAAAVLGIKWGALVIETVQQFDNDASYGQLRLVADGFGGGGASGGAIRFGVDTGFLLPDVQARFSGRYRPRWLNPAGARWATAMTAGLRYGKPQLGDDTTLYLETREFAVGLDWERPLRGHDGATAIFAAVGAGLRDERLEGDRQRQGQRSAWVSSAVARGAVGVRIRLGDLGRNWRLGLELGAAVSVPFDDGSLSIVGETYEALPDTLSASVAVLFERR